MTRLVRKIARNTICYRSFVTKLASNLTKIYQQSSQRDIDVVPYRVEEGWAYSRNTSTAKTETVVMATYTSGCGMLPTNASPRKRVSVLETRSLSNITRPSIAKEGPGPRMCTSSVAVKFMAIIDVPTPTGDIYVRSSCGEDQYPSDSKTWKDNEISKQEL